MSIFDNKVKYVRQLGIDLTIKSGYTIDYDNWIDQHSAKVDIPWNLLAITVTIDDHVLYQGTVGSDGVQLRHMLIDNDQPEQHLITFAIDGFTTDHSFFHQGQEINAQLLISQFEIENLDMRQVMSEHGVRTFVDRPGSDFKAHELLHGNGTQSLTFTTPIYPWLLNNFSNVLHSKTR